MGDAGPNALRREKRALRAAVRALRDGLSDRERATATRRIGRSALALPEIRRAATVLVFASFGSEVGTVPIVDGLVGRGARVALPRVEGREIVPIRFTPGDVLVEAAFGMPEPADGVPIDPSEIDAAVAPGLAFDRSGYRVGYGGGFFDRFFAAARRSLAKVGVCFSVQLVERVPRGPLDVPMDVVVTEREIVRPR